MSKFLRAHITAGGRRCVTWDEIPATANVEVLAKIRCDSMGTGSLGTAVGVALRVQDNGGTATGYVAGVGTNGMYAFRFVSNSLSTFESAVGGGVASDVWFWIRARVNGSLFQARYWEDGDPEPETWHVNEEETNVTDAGLVGFYPGWISSGNSDLAWFSVGLNGNAAPAPA